MLHSLDVEAGNHGSTVRNGQKWLGTVGEEIELCVCSDDNVTHEIKGHGIVTDIWYGPFFAIPAKLIDQEHEVRSRQYSGLLESMRKAYGVSFLEEKDVVVLTYLRKD